MPASRIRAGNSAITPASTITSSASSSRQVRRLRTSSRSAAIPSGIVSCGSSSKSTVSSAGSSGAAGTSAAAGVTLEQVSIDEIFPVFRSYYDDNPIGTATLKNGGSAAIENVKVELELKGYMDAKKPCTAVVVSVP